MKFNQALYTKIIHYSHFIYHYFFEYDLNKLTTYAQAPSKIIKTLEHALFYREFILITYQNGSTEIGQVIRRLSNGRFIIRSHDHKFFHIINLSDLFNIEVD